MFKKILVCLDGSEHGERILPYAIEQAQRFQSKLVLLRVGSLAPLTVNFSSPEQYRMASSIAADAALRGDLSEAKSYLTRIAESLASKGLEVDTATTIGPIAESIAKFIKDNCIDLVAMTAHVHTGWKRFFKGSAVDLILWGCSVPVLVVNPEHAASVPAAM